MLPTGIEPVLVVPQTTVLSVERRKRFLYYTSRFELLAFEGDFVAEPAASAVDKRVGGLFFEKFAFERF